MIIFFGCWTHDDGRSEGGHYFRLRNGQERLRRRRHDGTLSDSIEDAIPWGYKVDGRLAPRGATGEQAPNGVAGYHQAVSWVGNAGEEAWSLISWWDNSVDTRGASNCAFMVDRRATPEEILAEAKREYPQIFMRFKYEIVLPLYGAK